jgi:hypothetical protein
MRRLIAPLGTALLCAGCAFGNTPVKLAFLPPTVEAPAPVTSTIVLETLKDLRGGDPLVLANKGVQYKTSGQYTVETPVAQIVTDAIRDTLASLDYALQQEDGDLTLSGDLLRLESEPLMGFWSGQLDCTVQVNLRLSNRASGDLLWSESFTGFHKKTGIQVDHEGHRKVVTEAALADLTSKIATSATLRKALEKFAAP